MIKFKTNISFGFNLERKPQSQKVEDKKKKTISKVFLVAKEIVMKRWLKS